MEMYKTVAFKGNSEQVAIITAMLMNNGFDGVEEGEEQIVASAPAANFDEQAVQEIFDRFGVAFTVATVEQTNWNAKWEQSFEPVIVDDFAAVRASFHQPIADVKYDIIITPKMSFGTGHHATTYMMMEAMRSLDFCGKKVVDFGSGTAVLAILAEKMGADEVLAIDNDQWSMDNATENIQANNCTRIQVLLADVMAAEDKADIILANINLNVIVANLAHIKAASHLDTMVLLSGFLATDEQQITLEVRSAGFEVVRALHKNNWMAMLIKSV